MSERDYMAMTPSALAEAVLALPDVKGAEAVEVVVIGSRVGYTRMANNAVFQDSVVEKVQVDVRAWSQGTIGTARTTALTEADLRRCVQQAVAAAKSIGPGTTPIFDPGTAPVPEVNAYDPDTAALTAGAKADALAPLFAEAAGSDVLLAGAWHTHDREVAIANTQGMRRTHRGTLVDLRFNGLAGLRPGDATSYVGALVTRQADVDPIALGRQAIAKVDLGRDPKVIPAGRYDVLLEPEAVAELLEWMGYVTFSSQSMEDGSSLLADRIGEAVTGEAVTIIDDGPGSLGFGVPIPFDGEGTPKAPLTLIERGVARASCYDRRAAARAGAASTGHAVLGASDLGSSGSIPTQLVFMPGDLGHEELLARLGDGLWITRFHYVNANLEPRRAVMTGLTRDGTFWVKGGVPQHGVRNLRFTDSIAEAFERIDGLGAQLRSVATWWSDLGAITVPAMVIRGLRFTGTTHE